MIQSSKINALHDYQYDCFFFCCFLRLLLPVDLIYKTKLHSLLRYFKRESNTHLTHYFICSSKRKRIKKKKILKKNNGGNQAIRMQKKNAICRWPFFVFWFAFSWSGIKPSNHRMCTPLCDSSVEIIKCIRKQIKHKDSFFRGRFYRLIHLL